MIITLKNADFSASNIGTLSSWRITRSLGSGATYEGVTSVDKGASFTATVTIADGYEIGAAGVTITMGGAVVSAATVNGNVITISITEVTGNVVIKVPTVNLSTGEEEEPEVLTLDSIAYDGKSYREIFITNNMAPNINGNSFIPLGGNKLEFVNGTSGAGIPVIEKNSESAANYVPDYYLNCSGNGTRQLKSGGSANTKYKLSKMDSIFCAANIKVTSYTTGVIGVFTTGAVYDACLHRTTDGWEVSAAILTCNPDKTEYNVWCGSANSAVLDGYINNPVAIDMNIFTNKPSEATLIELYKTYNSLLIAENK